MIFCWRIINSWIDRKPGSWQNLLSGLCLYYVWSWGKGTGKYHDTADARWQFLDSAGVYKEMNRGERGRYKKSRWFFSLSVASVKPSKCFCFYLPHTLVLLQPRHSGPCHKMAACASNRPFKERRGEGTGGGVGREKNKCHTMQTVKRDQSALQEFYSTSWAEPQWLPADKPSLISGLLAAVWESHQLSAILAGCCTFKPPPALSSLWL